MMMLLYWPADDMQKISMVHLNYLEKKLDVALAEEEAAQASIKAV